MSGWRALGTFWVVVFLSVGGIAAILQVLGPPPRPVPAARMATAQPMPAPSPAPLVAAPLVTATTKSTSPVAPRDKVPPLDRPGRGTPGATADPEPSLLQAAPTDPSEMLPRISPDGRKPMQAYAAGFDPTSQRPRIGLVVAGIGLNQADSERAVHDLPRGVTFAISPYALGTQQLLTAARLADHEYLLSIPMEPQSFPLNDAGPQALMTNLPPEENQVRLYWAMSRIAGYVGVTDALGALRGERFAGLADQMNPVLAQIAQRGLLYVDARAPGADDPPPLPRVWSRAVDLVVDQPESQIDEKLAELEHIAKEKGSALGLAGAPLPVTVQHIAVWASGLMDRGLALAPVSALAVPPANEGK
ncbi:MAG TPA: divergent polysaccharide deacetylase family protein [Acetobacteraceae bacterium]|jgi:hypothetical protein